MSTEPETAATTVPDVTTGNFGKSQLLPSPHRSKRILRAEGFKTNEAEWEVYLWKDSAPSLGLDGKLRFYGNTRQERDDRIMELVEAGLSTRQIAKEIGCSHMTVSRVRSARREIDG